MTVPRWRIYGRLRDFCERHHRFFWTLHSLWALGAGVLVVVLADESESYATWVVAFLAATWLSTVLFARGLPPPPEAWAARLRHGIAAYVTRVMYQETLFFLLPFYFYSSTLDSPNVLLVVLLALLAVLACLDLLFARLLRRHRWFGLCFFGAVSFAALNLLLPLVVGLRLGSATVVAAVVGLLAATPMITLPPGRPRWRALALLGLPALAIVGLLLGFRVLVPPVPLRLESLTFAQDVERETMAPIEPLGRENTLSGDHDRLAFVATIFAPRRVEARIELRWWRDGLPLKTSREIEVEPYEAGFRVWDSYASAGGPLPAGTYAVDIRTVDGQLIGRGSVHVVD
jgi:Family of unknown function (DUF5924)